MIISYSREGHCEHESGCQKQIWARRLCRSHYEKMKKLNVGRIKIKPVRPDTADDLWQFVVAQLKKEKHPLAAQLTTRGNK